MKKHYFLKGFIVLVLMVVGGTSWGQIAQFVFPATNSLIVSSKDANVNVSNMGLSVGTFSASETNVTTGTYFPNEPYIEELGGWAANNQTDAKNFTFTITAAAGYSFSITNISFNAYATSAGPSAYGFAIGSTNIYNVNAPDGSLISVNQSVSGQTGLTTAIIKIQGWLNGSRSSTGGGAFKLDDVIINGSVTPIPTSTPTDYFRSQISGDWNSVGTWQSSPDNSNWYNATLTPDENANTITIQSGHTITVTESVSIDQTDVQPNGAIAVSSGATLTVLDDGLTIQSRSEGSGRIGQSAGAISGNVTVERYISSLNNRAYRLLAPSVNSQGTIRANWQEGANNTDLSTNLDLNSGYGTHITGSTTGANGFDATPTGGASLFGYVYGSPDAYQAVATTNSNLSATTGYLLYVRGDRTASHIGASATSGNTILRATGQVLVGYVDYTLEDIGRFTLVTNPYASSINWATIRADASTVGLEDFYTYVDPNVGTRGGYVTVNTTGTRSNNDAGVNGTMNIQSGQAFFVKSSATNRSLIIKEAHKSSTNNIDVFRVGTPEQFNIGLYFTANAVRRSADGVTIVYNNNYSKDIEKSDAEEMANFDENIAIMRSGKMLAIEGRPLIDANDTVAVSISRMKIQNYEFELTPVNFNAPGLQAFLQDKFLNSETPVSLTAKTVVPFSVTANTASSASDRFQVVFRQAATLPVVLTDVKAFEKAAGVQVEWTPASENNVSKFEVEKYANGVAFATAGVVAAKGNSNTSTTYNWFDPSPFKGANYYRVKTVDNDGSVEYSKVVKVDINEQAGSFTIYPNPVIGNTISLGIKNLAKGEYAIVISNKVGQQVYKTTFKHAGGTMLQTLKLAGNLPKGLYQLRVLGTETNLVQQLIKD